MNPSGPEIQAPSLRLPPNLLTWAAATCKLLPSVQFSSVPQSCPLLCGPMDWSMPGLLVCHQLPEFTQTHVHRVSNTIQPSHPLSFPSPPASNLSQHQGLFKWVNASHQVAKVLEFQLQHQSCQSLTHVHWVGDAIQPSHPLSSPSPPAFTFFQHQGVFKWVSSLHQVTKVLEFQLQHQSFQWISRTDFL